MRGGGDVGALAVGQWLRIWLADVGDEGEFDGIVRRWSGDDVDAKADDKDDGQ